MLNITSYIKYIPFLVLSIIVFLSCQEVYNPDDIDSSELIPVVNCRITNRTDTIELNLYWAAPLHGYKQYINNADITISDDSGNSIKLENGSAGRYYFYNRIKYTKMVNVLVPTETGTISLTYPTDTFKILFPINEGRSYFARILLEDGTIIESIPAVMNPVASIDSVYAKIDDNYNLSYDYDGEIRATKVRGLRTYMDISSPNKQKSYYYFKSKVVRQTSTVDSDIGATLYCQVYPVYNDDLIINSSENDGIKEVVKKQEIDFLEYIYIPSMNNSAAVNTVGWVMLTEIYSIDSLVYSYYYDTKKITEAEGNIFDPVPYQIKGNLRCLTDTTKVVLGTFEVASVTNDTIGFFWMPEMKNYLYKRKTYVTDRVTWAQCVGIESPEWFNFGI